MNVKSGFCGRLDCQCVGMYCCYIDENTGTKWGGL